MREEISYRVAHYRKLAGFTQSIMAEKLGMELAKYSRLERNGNMSLKTIKQIADILNIDSDILLCDEPSPPEPKSELFVLTAKEKALITIFRNLPKKNQNKLCKYALDLAGSKTEKK